MRYYLTKIDNKKKNLPLLLLADPEETAIDKYIFQCEVFEFYSDKTLIGQGAVTEMASNICELKNFAIYEEHQEKGYGKIFIELLCNYYKEKYLYILVGTSEYGSGFYEKCGFKFSHKIKDFFIDNYIEPIYENGNQCRDMLYLKRDLKI